MKNKVPIKFMLTKNVSQYLEICTSSINCGKVWFDCASAIGCLTVQNFLVMCIKEHQE